MLAIGLDIGTTSTIGILVDDKGNALATASRESDLHSPHPNWAEGDPEQWWRNACDILRELAAGAPERVAAVGVTGMLPAVVLLDADSRVLRRSMQQNDARALDEIEAMRRAVDPGRFLERTGGSVNQQLVAPKLRWLEAHEPEVFKKIATVLGAYDLIAHRLTGARTVEHNWALESGLYDLHEERFTEELVRHAGIPLDVLPEMRRPHEVIGGVTREAAGATGLPAGTPVVAGCADHIASAFVAGVVGEGDLLIKLGGAGDILLAMDRPRADPRLFLDYHIVPGLYLTNGCMAASGSVLKWIAHNLAAGEVAAARASGESVYARLDRMAAEVPPGAGGVVLLPYFLGEKTPLHDPYAKGTIVGLGLHHGLPHIWRAALEAVIFGFRHHIEVFAEMGLGVRRIVASDGGAASDLWLQIAADALGAPVTRIDRHPGSCLGAAYVALVGVGAIEGWERIADYVAPGRTFTPDARASAAYHHAYALFRGTYERLEDLYPSFRS
jgi:xylulokinase